MRTLGDVAFFLSCFSSNSLMSCHFRCEMKWNDYLLEMRLVLISNYLTTLTQNFSDTSVNTNKNYTNFINESQLKKRVVRSLINVIQSKKHNRPQKVQKPMLWMYLLLSLIIKRQSLKKKKNHLFSSIRAWHDTKVPFLEVLTQLKCHFS